MYQQKFIRRYCTLFLLFTLGQVPITVVAQEQHPHPVLLKYDLGQQGGWIPYQQSAQIGRPGIFEEITTLIQATTDLEFEAVHFPPKRAEKALLDGLVDFDFVCLEWLKDERLPGFVYSAPLFDVSEYVVTLRKNAALVPQRSAIYGHPVGTISGYFYFDDKHFTRMDFLNEKLLLLGLQHERFTSIIMEKETAKYWANLLEIDIVFTALHTHGSMLIRLRDEKRELMPQINQAIAQIKASGKLKSLLEKQGVEAVIPATPSSVHAN
ncbi:substrate-binding periplasmic protein [Flavobacterium sp. W21_SRS_FM6]|uniref:substrate-binding periplasmic protein n=1 Tax=Flavobacterium sp. W21_SRS_FM6 TaxID=3240268 RepID=UPI003F914A57